MPNCVSIGVPDLAGFDQHQMLMCMHYFSPSIRISLGVLSMSLQGGWMDPDVLLKIWKMRFEYFYREYDDFIFT